MSLPQPLSAHDLATADAQALHAETDGYYGQFELSKLRASPDNRKRFSEQGLQELAESIKAMGVAQAVLIRPVTPTDEAPEPFEIVAGERRFRASKLAGKTTIPALCRTLSDLDAAKIRILENLQREDPHPMEEAEGYQLLMLQHGFTADQLVDEVKKSRAYIYGRLKLCALTPEVRELFLDDKLPASTALLIARIPVPALQVEAAKEILNPRGTNLPMSVRDAASFVQDRYMLKLTAAVFSTSDAKLLATAGSCTKCPKRTGNQPEVFQGIDANVCTDPDCFAEKRAAHGAALLVQANKKGIPVLEGHDASDAMSRRWNRESELVTADMSLWFFNRNAPHTANNGDVQDYLKDDALPAIASYVKQNDGNLVPLYNRADIQAALEAAGACETVEAHQKRMQSIANKPGLAQPTTSAQLKKAKEDEERAAAREQAKKETAVRLAVYKQLRQRASVAGLSLPSLREYVRTVHDEHELSSAVHDLYDFDVSTDLDEYISQADAGALQLLLIDLMLGARLAAGFWHGDYDDAEFAPILAMARHEGIDVDAVRAEILSPKPEPLDAAEQIDADSYSAPVRYRHPNNPGLAWTGRGRQPRWISEWIEAGKQLDDLRVDATSAAADQVDVKQSTEVAPANEQIETSAPVDTPAAAQSEVTDASLAPDVAAAPIEAAAQVESEPTADDQADADQLAEMIAEDAQTTLAAQADKPKAKSSTKKPVTKTPAAAAKKPAKAAKSRPAKVAK